MTTTPVSRALRLVDELADAQLDALVVTDLHDIRWLTGFTGSNAVVLVAAGDGTPVLRFLTDFRYVTQAAEQVPDDWERIDGGRDLGGAGIATHLPDGVSRLGFDDGHLTVAAHRRLADALPDGVELVGAGDAVRRLRAVKDEGEVARIRASAELADAAFTQVVLEGPVVGRTERELAIDLETAMRRLGASGPSFDSIVAAGAHGALPHASPRDVAIPSGVLLTVDWGAILDGYCSDCTRTIATGPVDGLEREVYGVVLDAQRRSLAAVRAGAGARDVDAVARELIAAAGYGDRFGHGLGHGVGLEIHEAPTLSPRGSGVLRAGEIVTVEPGIYLPGELGVRIEDLAVVTADGSEVLNTLDKELLVLG